jgi:hypothetical protein
LPGSGALCFAETLKPPFEAAKHQQEAVMHGSFSTQGRTASQASPLPSAKKSSSAITVATFRQRDQWSRMVARNRRVKLMHRHALQSLALCARLDHNAEIVIDPTYAELARAAGCSARTVKYAVAAAEQVGVLRKARHGGRVPNVYELLLAAPNAKLASHNVIEFPGPTAEKAPEKIVEIQRPTVHEAPEKTQHLPCPTVHEVADAAGSNCAPACTDIRVESEAVINAVYEETVCVETSDDAPIAETPLQRAEALHKTVTERDQQSPVAARQPSRDCPEAAIGRPAHAGPGFDAVCRSARQVFGAKGDAVAVRLLAAFGDDVEDALDTLACAADEADPMNYLKLEVERLRTAMHH